MCGGSTVSVLPNPEGGSEVSRYCRKARCCVRHMQSNHDCNWTVNTSMIPTEGKVN